VSNSISSIDGRYARSWSTSQHQHCGFEVVIFRTVSHPGDTSLTSQGFGHGSVYKTAVVDLEEEEKRANKTGGKPKLKFSNVKSSPGEPGNESGLLEKFTDELDLDGLPFEGEVLEFGKPLCCMVDVTTGEHRIIKHKDHEKAFVETVRIIGNSKSVKSGEKVLLRRVSVTLRYPRSPVIGDKFSSRHGQKGTLSVLWPQVRAGWH
jgi:DNA-directed RNA polymerase I subunit RPA2